MAGDRRRDKTRKRAADAEKEKTSGRGGKGAASGVKQPRKKSKCEVAGEGHTNCFHVIVNSVYRVVLPC